MGCGSCIGRDEVHEPTLPIANAISNLINQYKQYVLGSQQNGPAQNYKHEPHPVLPLDDCQLVTNYMASTNGSLPTITIQTILSNNHNAHGSKHMLDKVQRIVWKCLILIPQYIGATQQVPPYKDQVPDTDEIVQMSFYQIKLDINRTFPLHTDIKREQLTMLLRNLVQCLSGLGYTQGMNYYAGFLLLLGFSPSEAYYMLVSLFISPSFMLGQAFNDSFQLAMVCNSILAQSLSEQLSSHLQQYGIVEQIYSLAWFLCSFLYTFQPQTCVLIWDYMLQSASQGLGYAAIVNLAIAIMQRSQSQLLSLHAPENILNVFLSQNINATFPPQAISIIIAQLKQMNKNGKDKYHKSKFKKQFITNKQLVEHDKQLKTAFTTHEGYQQYLNSLFIPLRKTTPASASNNIIKVNSKISQANETQIEHVGKPT